MRVETLRYLIAVVHFGSFAKAARALFISEQGLSKAIRGLEAELGVRLFERRGRNLALTEPGKIVFEHACAVERSCRDMSDSLARYEAALREGDSGARMELHVMPYLSNGLLKMLERPMDACGLNGCLIREMNYYDLVYQLEHGTFADLALVGLLERDYRSLAPKMRGDIEFSPLFSTEVLAAGGPSLLPGDASALTAAELAEYPLAQYNEQVLNRFADELFADVPRAKIRLMEHTSNSAKIVRMLREGSAVTFSDTFSAYVTNTERDSGNVIRFARIIPRRLVHVGFIRSRSSPDAARHLDYIDRYQAMLSSRFGDYIENNPVPPLEDEALP